MKVNKNGHFKQKFFEMSRVVHLRFSKKCARDRLREKCTEILLECIQNKDYDGMADVIALVRKDGFIFDGKFYAELVTHATKETFEKFLEWGFGVNHLLHKYILYAPDCSPELLNFFLASGADPNFDCDEEYISPLHMYSTRYNAHVDGVQLFLDYGANPKIPVGGTIPVMRRLLEAGALIDAQYPKNGNTYLHWCCGDGEAEKILFLLERGANPNIQNKNQQLPFDLLGKIGLKKCSDRGLSLCFIYFYKHGIATTKTITSRCGDRKLVDLPMLYMQELSFQLDKEAIVLLEGGGGDVLRAKVDISPSPTKHTNPFTCPYHLLQECFEMTMTEMMDSPQCVGSRSPENETRVNHIVVKCKLMAVIVQNSALARSVLESQAQSSMDKK